MTLKYLPLVSLLLIACGGSTPSSPAIDGSRKLSSLSDQERQDLCAWEISAEGGEGKQYNCSDGNKLTILSVGQCEQGLKKLNSSCELTYGDLKACADEMAKDACSAVTSNACQMGAAKAQACTGGASILLPSAALPE
jgi:hypothetical protein